MMILDYHDACIYPQDLELVEKENQWLNDSVMHFYFTYLQQQHRQLTTTMATPTSPRASSNKAIKRLVRPRSSPCLFMDPSVVSFWMHQCTDQDDLDGFKSGIPFPLTPSRSVSADDNDNSNEGRFDEEDEDDNVDGYILVPINDNHAKSSDWTRPGSGMHWSLLLVCVNKKKRQTNNMDEKDDKTQPKRNESSSYPSSPSSPSVSSNIEVRFYHFDSSKSSGNIRAARDVAKQLYEDIYCPAPFREGNSCSVTVVPLPTPQQTNGYDCGVHVLGAARVFLSLVTGTSGRVVSSDVKDDDGFTTVDMFCTELTKIFGPDPGRYCRNLRNEVATLIRRLANKESARNIRS